MINLCRAGYQKTAWDECGFPDFRSRPFTSPVTLVLTWSPCFCVGATPNDQGGEQPAMSIMAANSSRAQAALQRVQDCFHFFPPLPLLLPTFLLSLPFPFSIFFFLLPLLPPFSHFPPSSPHSLPIFSPLSLLSPLLFAFSFTSSSLCLSVHPPPPPLPPESWWWIPGILSTPNLMPTNVKVI